MCSRPGMEMLQDFGTWTTAELSLLLIQVGKIEGFRVFFVCLSSWLFSTNVSVI